MINTDLFNNIALSSAVVIPVIVALVQVVKMTGWLQDKFAPIVSIVMGIILAFLLAQNIILNFSSTILAGILYGLSASGLYSGVRTTSKAIQLDRMRANKKEERNHNK